MTKTTKIGLFSLVDHLEDPVTGTQITEQQRLLNLIELGVLAEKAGFERFAVGEHHFSKYILPNPKLILAAVATRTQHIKLFTTVTLLAYRETIQLVEDINLLDNICNGRLEISFARGVSFEAGAQFGITRENVYDIMKQKLHDILQMLKTNKVESNTDLNLYPKPIQKPHPLLWIGGGLNKNSCALAVNNALPLILPSLFKYPEDYLPFLERYRNGMVEKEQQDQTKVAFPSYCWVAKNSQDAKKQWKPRLMNYVSFAKNLRKGFGRPMDFEGMLKGPAICGSPAEVVDRISSVNETLGLNNHILIMDVGGMPQTEMQDCLTLMGIDVLPHF